MIHRGNKVSLVIDFVLSLFSIRIMTRGQVLRYALAFAMRGLRFKHAPLGLAEETRHRLADEAVTELQRYGHWKELEHDRLGLNRLGIPKSVGL